MDWIGPSVIINSCSFLHCGSVSGLLLHLSGTVCICSYCLWITDILCEEGVPTQKPDKMLLALNINAVGSGNSTLQGSGVNTVYQHWEQNWESQAFFSKLRTSLNLDKWKFNWGMDTSWDELDCHWSAAWHCLFRAWTKLKADPATNTEKLKHTQL